MEIAFLGHAAFKVKTEAATVVIDPYSPDATGLPWHEIEADLLCVTHSHRDHSFTAGVKGSPFLIEVPGEYEIKGVRVEGYPAFHDRVSGAERGRMVLYRIEAEGIVFCHFGNLGHPLETELMEKINGVDVLALPVGGISTITFKEAAKLATDLEPKIVLPMHFRHETEALLKFEPIESFLSEMKTFPVRHEEKLVLKTGKPVESLEVVVLKEVNLGA